MNVSAFDPQRVAVTILDAGRASLDVTDKDGCTVLIYMPTQIAQTVAAWLLRRPAWLIAILFAQNLVSDSVTQIVAEALVRAVA